MTWTIIYRSEDGTLHSESFHANHSRSAALETARLKPHVQKVVAIFPGELGSQVHFPED